MLSSDHLISLIRKVSTQVIRDRRDLVESFVQGTIDPSYVSGRPKVRFDGETLVSGKQYPYLSSYTPAANDVVILARISGTYIILGKKM